MAKDISADVYRGLLLPDPRLTFSDSYASTLSSVTQAGPKPGVPVAQQETKMVLQATGTQSADKKLRVRCIRAGQPGPDEGGFAFEYEGDPLYYAWDPPQSIKGFEFIEYTTVANTYVRPDAVTLDDGTIVGVIEEGITGQVLCRVRNPTTGVWSASVVYTPSALPSFNVSPTVMVRADGRLLCFFWTEDTTANEAQIRMMFSDDDGATWSTGQVACLLDAVDLATYTPKRLRGGIDDAEILLVGWVSTATEDQLIQFGSDDSGASFTTVDTMTGQARAYPDVITFDGSYYVAFLSKRTPSGGEGAHVPYLRVLANPFQTLSGADASLACQTTNPMEWGASAGSLFSDGDLAMWADEDGIIYMAGRDHDTAGGAEYECYVQRSTDRGDTWAMTGSGSAQGLGAPWWHGNDASTYPKDFCAVAQRGRAVFLHRFAANPDNHDDSLCATYVGAYTTVCLPCGPLDARGGADNRAAFERTWLPFDEPDQVGAVWIKTTVGAPTITLTSAGLLLSGGAGDSVLYTDTLDPSPTLTEGAFFHVWVKVTSGTVYVDVEVGVSGPASYRARVMVSPTDIILRDVEAGADIGSASTTTDGASGVHILLAVGNPTTGAPGNDGRCHAWYAADAKCSATALQFKPVGSIGSSTTLQKGTSTFSHAYLGTLVSTECHVRIMQDTYGQTGGGGANYAGVNLYSGQSQPDDLLARNFSSTPLYVDDGVKIAAVDGPAFVDDEWDIDAAYEHGVELMHPEVNPSPNRPWRSVDDASAVDLVWEYDADVDQEVSSLGPAFGLYLGNINWRTGSLWGYDKDGAAWVKLCDIDAAAQQSTQKFVREGSTVRPDTGTTHVGNVWYTYNILAGSHLKLTGAGPVSVVRRVRENSEGAWTDKTTKRVRCIVEDVDPTDPTAGDLEVWSKEVLVVVHNATKYTRLKLTIDAQDTAEGYFQIGVRVLGHVVYFGRQYSRGRGRDWEPTASLDTGRNGTRRGRKLGPTRRRVKIPWTDLVPARPIMTDEPRPDYLLSALGSTEPVAVRADTLYQLAGIVEARAGSTEPVVYCAALPLAPNVTATSTIVNRNLLLYGRIVTGVTIDQPLGDEWDTEVLTSPGIAIEEEL